MSVSRCTFTTEPRCLASNTDARSLRAVCVPRASQAVAMTTDGTLRDPQSGYRPNVGVCVCESEHGRVLAFQRLRKDKAWQFPQGGIDHGESAEEAGVAASPVLAKWEACSPCCLHICVGDRHLSTKLCAKVALPACAWAERYRSVGPLETFNESCSAMPQHMRNTCAVTRYAHRGLQHFESSTRRQAYRRRPCLLCMPCQGGCITTTRPRCKSASINLASRTGKDSARSAPAQKSHLNACIQFAQL